MKILLTSIGTRGDIEPFLALGELLAGKGHQVLFSFPEQFAAIVPDSACFYPLSPKVIELIESDEGRALMGKASLWKKIKSLLYLYREGQKMNKELIVQQFEAVNAENPDLIIHNVKCSYPTLWGLEHSKPTILLSPVPYFMHYVKGHAHIGFNKNLGEVLNKLTYRISNYGLIKTIYDGQKWLPQKYEYPKSVIREQLMAKKIVFSISPVLFPRPDYWPNNAQVLGFHERDKLMQWQPDKPLEDFLSQHDKIVFLTFGSMVNSKPEETSKMLYESLKELGIPTIVNTASGGLVELPKFKAEEKFHFVQSIPYEWIFKRVYAVIHHGGSGTTHTTIKYGCVSLILPHIIDQFGWNHLVKKLGVGPEGISINKLTAVNVKGLIRSLYYEEGYKTKAEELAAAMRTEKMEDNLMAFIENETDFSTV
jgi:UDP:flavonoid glycosyltransferase YjiC (YdhE family)